jgi:hypothetical protein
MNDFCISFTIGEEGRHGEVVFKFSSISIDTGRHLIQPERVGPF